jgi:hypothetical protein
MVWRKIGTEAERIIFIGATRRRYSEALIVKKNAAVER